MANWCLVLILVVDLALKDFFVIVIRCYSWSLSVGFNRSPGRGRGATVGLLDSVFVKLAIFVIDCIVRVVLVRVVALRSVIEHFRSWTG